MITELKNVMNAKHASITNEFKKKGNQYGSEGSGSSEKTNHESQEEP